MPDQVRVGKVVLIKDGLVYTRTTRANAAVPAYAPLLQDILLEEGPEALAEVAHRYFQGLVRKRGILRACVKSSSVV